jgi:ParB family chromosome partitioning protein
MAKATTAPATRTLERIPVDKITTGLNVRTDATPDDALVASIKANGILQPPTVVLLDNGDYEIVIGHRRANAAAKAGLTEIDALVITAALAEEIRLVEQIVENEQRQNLTDAERAGGYRQLELFAVSPAQIATRLGVKRDRVDVVLKVAGNEATAAAVAEHGVSLDQAAQMLEFADDAKAIKKLTETATTDPDRFAHALADTRRSAELKAHKAALQEQLAATGFRILNSTKGYNYGTPKAADEPTAVSIEALGQPGNPTEKLTSDELAGKPYAAARIHEGHMYVENDSWREWAVIQYFVIDPEANGIPELSYAYETPAARELSPEEIADQKRRTEAEAERQAIAAARAAATEVRRAWLHDLLQRKNLPDAGALILQIALAEYIGAAEQEYPPAALELLGIPTPDDFDGYEAGTLVRERLTQNPANGIRFLLAAAINVAEGEIGRSWHRPGQLDIDYLRTLETWGYGLSEAEQNQITEAETTIAEALAAEQDDSDPEDEAAEADEAHGGDESDDPEDADE